MKYLQDQIPNNHCYGCGPENPLGMQIKSHWDGTESVCRYTPRAEQCAGPTQYLYGGTIASLIDCHCIGTAIAHQYESDGYAIGEGPPIWCVTAKLDVTYRAPTPIDKAVLLRASIVNSGKRKTTLKCLVYSEGAMTAEGEVIAVRVSDSW